MADDRELYDVRNAARRVHRSRITIYRWMNHGMRYRTIGGRRYVEHDTLLLTLRTAIGNKRKHQFAPKKVLESV